MRLRQIKAALARGDHGHAARITCETVDAPVIVDALGTGCQSKAD